MKSGRPLPPVCELFFTKHRFSYTNDDFPYYFSLLQALREMRAVFEVENDSRNSRKGNFTNSSQFFKRLNQFTTIFNLVAENPKSSESRFLDE